MERRKPKAGVIECRVVKRKGRAFTNTSEEKKRNIKEKVAPLINKEGKINQ